MYWLPVEERIKDKIASITHKSLYYQQPSYLNGLLFLSLNLVYPLHLIVNCLNIQRATNPFGIQFFFFSVKNLEFFTLSTSFFFLIYFNLKKLNIFHFHHSLLCFSRLNICQMTGFCLNIYV